MKTKELIIEKNLFLEMAKQKNITAIEVVPDVELSVQLVCDEEDFLNLASVKTANVFYCYEYPKDYEVLITGDTFAFAKSKIQEIIEYLEISEEFYLDLDREIYPDLEKDEDEDDEVIEEHYKPTSLEKKIKKEVLAYNAQIDRESLTTPLHFMAFFIDGGCLIGVDKEVETPSWSIAEEKLYSILTIHKDLIEQKKETNENTKKEIKEKLKSYLKNDTQFKISTNKALRKEYAETLWKNKEFKWIKAGFNKGFQGYPPNDYFNFIERVFNEIKYFRTSSIIIQKE